MGGRDSKMNMLHWHMNAILSYRQISKFQNFLQYQKKVFSKQWPFKSKLRKFSYHCHCSIGCPSYIGAGGTSLLQPGAFCEEWLFSSYLFDLSKWSAGSQTWCWSRWLWQWSSKENCCWSLYSSKECIQNHGLPSPTPMTLEKTGEFLQ